MISPERKQQILNQYFEALSVIDWLDNEELLSKKVQSHTEAAINYACSSREERMWLSDQIPSDISEEDKESLRTSRLQSEIAELLIQIDDLYEPVVQYRICPDLTGHLFNVDDECELFSFNSLEECIEKMKGFISSY